MTRRVTLLGKPLRRRHSQVMHDAAFAAAGIDACYELRELDADEVEAAVAAARTDEWLGLGVTAPYKKVVAGLCDVVEGEASSIGAVNNVTKDAEGRLVGFNSDAPGFRAGVERAMDRDIAQPERLRHPQAVVVNPSRIPERILDESLQGRSVAAVPIHDAVAVRAGWASAGSARRTASGASPVRACPRSSIGRGGRRVGSTP